MKDFCSYIENRIVYPILIKNNGNSYLTLYYYTERFDSILHNDAKNLLYFQSKEDMERFCKNNEFKIENDFSQIDVPLRDLRLKKDTLIACIIRNHNVIYPGGNDRIELHDRVVIVTKSNHISSINEIFE